MRTQGSDILRDAAVSLGLPWDASSSVYDSEDTNVLQLLTFSNEAGQDLAREYNWTGLQKRLEVAILPGVTSYALPSDFLRPIPETIWGRNTWTKAYAGPTPSQWEDIRAWQPATTLRAVVRIQGESLEIMAGFSSQGPLTLAYQSAWWAAPGGQAMSSEYFTADTPETSFDRRLMVTAVKVRYLEGRGFDSTAARLDYERAAARAMGADGVSPTLRIGGSRWALPPTLRNLPPTGWGT